MGGCRLWWSCDSCIRLSKTSRGVVKGCMGFKGPESCSKTRNNQSLTDVVAEYYGPSDSKCLVALLEADDWPLQRNWTFRTQVKDSKNVLLGTDARTAYTNRWVVRIAWNWEHICARNIGLEAADWERSSSAHRGTNHHIKLWPPLFRCNDHVMAL